MPGPDPAAPRTTGFGRWIAARLGLATTDQLSEFKIAMEARMSSAEQTEAASEERFAALLGTVVAEIKSLRTAAEAFPAQLAAAVAAGDQAKVEALAADSIKDAQRLDGYAAVLSDLYPQPVPPVEEPPAGEPATPAPTPEGEPDVEVPDVEEPEVSIPLPGASGDPVTDEGTVGGDSAEQ